MSTVNDHSGTGSRRARHDVEVLTGNDPWARYGPKLPDSIPAPSPGRPPRRWRRWGICTAGALFTLGLHALLLSTLLLGTPGRPPVKPFTEGAAASHQNDNASEFVSMVLMLNDRSITPPDRPPDESAYAALQAMQRQTQDVVILTSPDTVNTPDSGGSADGADEHSPTAEATGDGAGRAMLFGRYMGQIKARIERAWEYPVSAAPDRFACRVQIKQNRQGEVQEITLQRCGDDPAWQVSLVQAIQQASPLSAPPAESVFTEVVTLNFDAVPVGQVAGTRSVADGAGNPAGASGTGPVPWDN